MGDLTRRLHARVCCPVHHFVHPRTPLLISKSRNDGWLAWRGAAALQAKVDELSGELEDLRGENEFLNGEVARYTQKNRDLAAKLGAKG